jgi:Uncharacterized protein conserved in bacteria (DUF2252)
MTPRAADASRTKKGAKAAKRAAKTARKEAAKARTRDSLRALSKLAERVSGRYQIVSRPPVIVPARDLEATYGIPRDKMERLFREQFRAYRATLRDDHRHLLERFEPVDMARKVVGVGSVGTLAYIVLLQGRDQGDPLFLQLKEATASVLEDHLPASRYKHHGQRVVCGQRMMQVASDIYLGWTEAKLPDVHHFYWRQLRDMKGSPDVETMAPATLAFYGRACGWTLARAHARSGRPDRHRRLSGRGRPVRPVDGGLLRTLRRPERAGLPGLPRGDPVREAAGTPRCLKIDERHHHQHHRVAKGPLELRQVPEVPPVDAGEQGRHGPDGDPHRDPAHVVVLPHRHLGQVGLKHVGQQVPRPSASSTGWAFESLAARTTLGPAVAGEGS